MEQCASLGCSKGKARFKPIHIVGARQYLRTDVREEMGLRCYRVCTANHNLGVYTTVGVYRVSYCRLGLDVTFADVKDEAGRAAVGSFVISIPSRSVSSSSGTGVDLDTLTGFTLWVPCGSSVSKAAHTSDVSI